jgi:hypothetical protein
LRMVFSKTNCLLTQIMALSLISLLDFQDGIYD